MNIYTLSLEDLASVLSSWEQPAFRAKQVREWIYDKGVLGEASLLTTTSLKSLSPDFHQMGNLPVGLRQRLAEAFSFGALRLAQEQVSKDGTVKRAYALLDDQLIESVLMP